MESALEAHSMKTPSCVLLIGYSSRKSYTLSPSLAFKKAAKERIVGCDFKSSFSTGLLNFFDKRILNLIEETEVKPTL